MAVKLIVELLAPNEKMRIFDPTVGSGGMLIENMARAHAAGVAAARESPRNVQVASLFVRREI